MAQHVNGVERFAGMTASMVHRYINEVHYLIALADKNGLNDEVAGIVEQIVNAAGQLPVDSKWGRQIAFNIPIIAHARLNHHPVIAIDNQELIAMLRDTDVDAAMLQRVQMPFDEFVICFEYRGWNFEAVAAKVAVDAGYMDIKDLTVGPGEHIYAAQGFMYRQGGKRPIVELYDMDVSTSNTTFEFFTDMDDKVKEVMLEAVRIFNGLFLYLSTPRIIEYVQKKRTVIRKAVNNIAKTKRPAYLFNDLRYQYGGTNTGTGTGISRKAHLVRGHFRRQPYGPRDNPEYKTKFIEPYWTTGTGERAGKTYLLN